MSKRSDTSKDNITEMRRRLEDYLDSRRLYDELNDIATEREKERHFDSLMQEIAA